MPKVIVERRREDDDVVNMHQARLPLEPREDDIYCTLKRRRGVRKPEGHLLESKSTAMTCKCRLVAILLAVGYLPETPIAIQCRKELRVT